MSPSSNLRLRLKRFAKSARFCDAAACFSKTKARSSRYRLKSDLAYSLIGSKSRT
jgi:hypothetical protein